MADDNELTLNLPTVRKAKALIWRDIGVYDTDKLLRLTDPTVIKNTLQESLQISEDPKGRHFILIDAFYHAIRFCQKNSFSSEKTSCFLSIIKQTHECATETPFGNLGETVKFFKDLVICHSVHRPPFSLGIFSPQEASAISYYFIDTYFRHFKLYKYAFTPQVQLDLSINYLKIPKTQQELDNERKSLQEDLKVSARSEGEGLPDLNKIEVDPSNQPDDGDTAAADLKAAALKELKRIIRDRLVAEAQDLRSGFNNQLKVSDDTLGKLVAPNGAAAVPQAADGDEKKSRQQSAKKKK